MRKINRFAMVCVAGVMMSSCYVQTHVVGDGAQGNTELKEWNHYLISGLVPLDVKDAGMMAGDNANYEVTTKHTFVNGLLSAITFGIYAPTTTTVKY